MCITFTKRDRKPAFSPFFSLTFPP